MSIRGFAQRSGGIRYEKGYVKMKACLFQAANRSPFFYRPVRCQSEPFARCIFKYTGYSKVGGKRESCDAHYFPGSARLSPGRKEGMEQGLSCIHIVKFSRLECKKSIRFC